MKLNFKCLFVINLFILFGCSYDNTIIENNNNTINNGQKYNCGNLLQIDSVVNYKSNDSFGTNIIFNNNLNITFNFFSKEFDDYSEIIIKEKKFLLYNSKSYFDKALMIGIVSVPVNFFEIKLKNKYLIFSSGFEGCCGSLCRYQYTYVIEIDKNTGEAKKLLIFDYYETDLNRKITSNIIEYNNKLYFLEIKEESTIYTIIPFLITDKGLLEQEFKLKLHAPPYRNIPISGSQL